MTIILGKRSKNYLERFEIMNNGSGSYYVTKFEGRVELYLRDYCDNVYDMKGNQNVLHYKVTRIIEGYDDDFGTNSLLLQLNGDHNVIEPLSKKRNFESITKGKAGLGTLIEDMVREYQYVYIGGTEVYEFSTLEKIKNYYSMVGNNMVPYPVAESENFVFYMLDRKYGLKESIPNIKEYWDDYSIYYKLSKEQKKEFVKEISNIKDIIKNDNDLEIKMN